MLPPTILPRPQCDGVRTIDSAFTKEAEPKKGRASSASVQHRETVLLSRLDSFAAVASSNDGHSITVDCKRFIQEKGLLGYVKNIEKVEVKKDGRLTVSGRLALLLYDAIQIEECSRFRVVVVVTSQRNSFRCQEAMLIAQMFLNPQEFANTTFKLVEVGTVSCLATTPTFSAEDHACSKMAEVKRACEIKYGKTDQDRSLMRIVSSMTDAAVKFDILGTEPRKTLKLESIATGTVSGCGLSEDSRSVGTFVLYNYARLSTLVINYEDDVKRGLYPSLPSNLSEIDYSLLTNEEEWDLVYSFLFPFPAILEEASSLVNDPGHLQIQPALKKLCQFLSRMCHAFSSYYSRVKVLLGPEPHLFPLIHARMSLILALKQVLFNGLQILGINPLDQL